MPTPCSQNQKAAGLTPRNVNASLKDYDRASQKRCAQKPALTRATPLRIKPQAATRREVPASRKLAANKLGSDRLRLSRETHNCLRRDTTAEPAAKHDQQNARPALRYPRNLQLRTAPHNCQTFAARVTSRCRCRMQACAVYIARPVVKHSHLREASSDCVLTARS